MIDSPMGQRPRVFIGSSSEGLGVARTLQLLLDRNSEVEIWDQGVFEPGGLTLPSLIEAAHRFDFAIFVVSPDDVTATRGRYRSTPRDNIVFELGLFMGTVGPRRAFMVYEQSVQPDLPSDLAGVTAVTFRLHSSGNMRASLGAAATTIEDRILRMGPLISLPMPSASPPRVAGPEDAASQEHSSAPLKAVAASSSHPAPSMTPLNGVRQEFFRDVLQHISVARPAVRVPARASANWLSFAGGPFGYWCISVTQDRRIRMEAYLDNGDRTRNKALFDHVRATISAPTGLDVSWERLDGRRASRIAAYYDDVPPFDDDAGRRTQAIAWATATFTTLYDAYDASLRSKSSELRQ